MCLSIRDHGWSHLSSEPLDIFIRTVHITTTVVQRSTPYNRQQGGQHDFQLAHSSRVLSVRRKRFFDHSPMRRPWQRSMNSRIDVRPVGVATTQKQLRKKAAVLGLPPTQAGGSTGAGRSRKKFYWKWFCLIIDETGKRRKKHPPPGTRLREKLAGNLVTAFHESCVW